MKMKKVVLEDYRDNSVFSDKPFKVKKLTNSIRYEIGAFLPKSEVDVLNADRNWTVDVVKRP